MSTLMRRVHHVSLVAPYELCRVGDHGDAPVNPIDLHDSLKRIEAFFARLHAAGAAPLSAGGDHLVTLPILRAIARERPVGIVHFDAHSDTSDSYFGGEKYTHGTPFRRADRGGADRPQADDPDRRPRLDVFGRREGLGRERRHPHRPYRGILPARPGCGRSPRRAAIVGDGPVYVSFDVDGLDPVYAPGTGTPEIGGFSTAEAQRMIRGLDGLDLDRRRCRRGGAALRSLGQHGAGRRDDDVRDPVRAGPRGAPPQEPPAAAVDPLVV